MNLTNLKVKATDMRYSAKSWILVQKKKKKNWLADMTINF